MNILIYDSCSPSPCQSVSELFIEIVLQILGVVKLAQVPLPAITKNGDLKKESRKTGCGVERENQQSKQHVRSLGFRIQPYLPFKNDIQWCVLDQVSGPPSQLPRNSWQRSFQ